MTYRTCSKRSQREESFCSRRCRSLYCDASNSNSSQGSLVDKSFWSLLLIFAIMREIVVPVFTSVAGGANGGFVKLCRGIICNCCGVYIVIPNATMTGGGVEKSTADGETVYNRRQVHAGQSWPANRENIYPFRSRSHHSNNSNLQVSKASSKVYLQYLLRVSSLKSQVCYEITGPGLCFSNSISLFSYLKSY